ncbi:MAG: bacterial transcriptional activator domain-containing protein [Anaerolineae bacterium]|nr:bacterial transcriptional activator domain-containing protein [Anaerolineae bacterium]
MSTFTVHLFGRFQVQHKDQVLDSLNTHKVQELFAYLLLYGKQLHCRETLAALLWDTSSTAQSLKYLRHTLWKLQLVLDRANGAEAGRLFSIDAEWIGLNPEADLWLDLAAFEQASTCTKGIPGQVLDANCAQMLQNAVQLYRGDLLEGWYQDWCLYERERLQNMYLAMLSKLMSYCEAHHEYESGLAYGTRILHYDRAHESTHRQMMRLYYLAHDRTAALHQYERCVAALREELDVKPDKRTVVLYEQIRADQLDDPTLAPVVTQAISTSLPELLNHLNDLRTVLTNVVCRLEQEIQIVELFLSGQH